ncbi:MAG: hypothetical protein AABZ06_01520, partial [Bdellovibrionota bacterium]
MEKRKPINQSISKPPLPSKLPPDYLKMVADVFEKNFDHGLKEYSSQKATPSHFETHGEIYPDEIIISVSLVAKGHLAATTIYASSDFDPKASAPSAEDLLSSCVDAIGSVYIGLLSPEKITQF